MPEEETSEGSPFCKSFFDKMVEFGGHCLVCKGKKKNGQRIVGSLYWHN